MAKFACGRRKWPLGRALAGAALLLAMASSGDPALAQGAVKSVHGDWQIRCDTPPGAQSEQCALMQSVTAEDRPNVGLTVIVLIFCWPVPNGPDLRKGLRSGVNPYA